MDHTDIESSLRRAMVDMGHAARCIISRHSYGAAERFLDDAIFDLDDILAEIDQ